jgi:hypothetical protein
LNSKRSHPSASVERLASGPLDSATIPAGTRSVVANGVLKPGSSKQTKALRASSGSNCV